jgi:hypothetical protein
MSAGVPYNVPHRAQQEVMTNRQARNVGRADIMSSRLPSHPTPLLLGAYGFVIISTLLGLPVGGPLHLPISQNIGEFSGSPFAETTSP